MGNALIEFVTSPTLIPVTSRQWQKQQVIYHEWVTVWSLAWSIADAIIHQPIT